MPDIAPASTATGRPDPAMAHAMLLLNANGWTITRTVNRRPHGGTGQGDDLYLLAHQPPAQALRGSKPARHLFTRTELLLFCGVADAEAPPQRTPAADPLDVIDWHGHGHAGGNAGAADKSASPPDDNRLFFACLLLLGLCLTVLALIGAADVIENTLILYRSIQP